MRRGARSEPYAARRAAREEGKPKARKNGSALGRFGFFFLGKRRCASRPPLLVLGLLGPQRRGRIGL